MQFNATAAQVRIDASDHTSLNDQRIKEIFDPSPKRVVFANLMVWRVASPNCFLHANAAVQVRVDTAALVTPKASTGDKFPIP